jgi:hypothetical protein
LFITGIVMMKWFRPGHFFMAMMSCRMA